MTKFTPITWEELQALRKEIYSLEISMENLPEDHPQYINAYQRLLEVEGQIERNLIHINRLQKN